MDLTTNQIIAMVVSLIVILKMAIMFLLPNSSFKKFISIFTGSEEILEYKILAYGTKKHMKSKEYQMLTDANAMHNDMYYNKSNGSPAYHIPDLDKCRDWANRLISGEGPS